MYTLFQIDSFLQAKMFFNIPKGYFTFAKRIFHPEGISPVEDRYHCPLAGLFSSAEDVAGLYLEGHLQPEEHSGVGR